MNRICNYAVYATFNALNKCLNNVSFYTFSPLKIQVFVACMIISYHKSNSLSKTKVVPDCLKWQDHWSKMIFCPPLKKSYLVKNKVNLSLGVSAEPPTQALVCQKLGLIGREISASKGLDEAHNAALETFYHNIVCR